MKRKYIYILILLLCTIAEASAQNRMLNSNGSSASGRSLGNRDRNGNPIDTTAVTDASTIPIGMHTWKITRRLGNVIPVPVDTLQSGFQNSDDTGGPTGQYNYLGNLGSPRMSRIFFDCHRMKWLSWTLTHRTPIWLITRVSATGTVKKGSNLIMQSMPTPN